MYCASCGHQIIENAKFCDNCGKPVVTTPQQETVLPPVTQSPRITDPGRGGLILTFGILSLVLFGPILGIPAWRMGSTDLRKIRAGVIAASQKGPTEAGMVLGIIGTWIGMIIIVGFVLAVGISMFSGQRIQSNKDAILSDLNNLGADAYQFKIRPASMGGGNGAYDYSEGGFAFSIKASGPWGTSNPNATYTIISQSANSITFTATSKSVTGSTVTITFHANGSGDTPIYTGQFS